MRKLPAPSLSKLKKTIFKLTILDWFAVLVAIAALMFLGFYIFRKETLVTVEMRLANKEWWWRREFPPYWLADSIKVGDEELDNRGRKIVEVVDLRIYELEGDSKDVYLTVKLKAVISGRDKKMKFKNWPLEVGVPIEFHLTNTLVKGMVVYVEGLPDTRVWQEKTIEVRLLTHHPWEAEAIRVGSQMKDGRDRVMAEVLEKKTEFAKEIVLSPGRGAERVSIVTTNPLKRDVTLKLRLLLRAEGENWYFLGDQKVKVGEALWISLPEIDLKGAEILKIIDE